MATRQPLRGTSDKLYDVIVNFNKGIDKKTADDVSLDSSFKNLKNFYNAAEGYLSKRPGVYDSNLTAFLERVINNDYDSEKFRLYSNKFGESKSTYLSRLTDFYNTIIRGQVKSKQYEGAHFQFQLDKIVGLQVLKNNFFLDALQEYEKLLNGEEIENLGSDTVEFACIIVGAGKYGPHGLEIGTKLGLYIARINVIMKYDKYDLTGQYAWQVKLEIDTVDATNRINSGDPERSRWDFIPDGYVDGDTREIMPIDISNYNGYSYITSGTDYLIRIEQFPDRKTVKADYSEFNESNIIEKIGGYAQENIYKPTAIELNQIGFNILSRNPLSWYINTGSVNKTKGVFYSIDITKNGETFKQPVTKIPYNTPFYMHVLYTGSNAPTEIKYRPDNGEVDIEKNPYKNLPGAWDNTEKTIWKCSGIDSDQKFELYIKLGTDEFRTYVTTTSTPIDDTGYISEISKMVFASTHSKIINNQLVLYGNHGYIFFSEYDDFTYFPNYFYVYIASEAGEEAVTNISYFRQYYAVFTNKRIKRMAGTFGSDNFGIYPLCDYVGCPNGRTVKNIGNNLLFLGSDGIYKLKQGYLGEGTENIEKIDEALDGELNLNNVVQAFVMNNNYVVTKTNGCSWIVFNTLAETFYEYELEPKNGTVYENEEIDKDMQLKYPAFYSLFQSSLYDENGDFMIVPMYNYTYSDNYTKATLDKVSFMTFRFNDLDFIEEEKRHSDGEPFISMLETHAMNMGYPTHTKKFKDVYIKLYNNTGHPIPLYVTIIVDDTVVLNPADYFVYFNEENETYYYIKKIENNATINIANAIGEFTLGKDTLGEKTIQQIRFRVRTKGRSIKIILQDGYDDYTTVTTNEGQRGIPTRQRNEHDFSISSIGIVFKLKKVREG